MKTTLCISVKKPCSEKFDNFSKTSDGGFCSSCEKEVIDFTPMTNEQITNYFMINNSKTCGRFKASQLLQPTPKVNRIGFSPMGVGIVTFSLLSLCTLSTVQAQNKIVPNEIHQITLNDNHIPIQNKKLENDTYVVKGIVLDDQNTPLYGVNVVLKGTNEGVVTDFDGKFEFSRPLEANEVLVFSYLGYDSKEYIVPTSSSEIIDVTITFDASDIILMGDVVVEGAYKSKRNIFQKFFSLFK